ncbi:MAG: DUF1700 domain-containing protein [Oscillospiraceae bacterium]|nr:DUF1700 domain-containing protein [Oscillospiraceae bacterium]
MTKLNFLFELHERLSDLPQNEVEERLTFYIETIEDRMEEGLSEEDAVAAVGSIDEIAAQIISEISSAAAKEEVKPKRKQRKAWEIVLLVLGSPLWIVLLIAAFAVVLSLYISLWAVIISLWAVFAAFAGCAFGGIVGGACLALGGYGHTGIAIIGAGFVCAGLAIFLFYCCKAATKGTLRTTKKIFHKKEA